MDRPTTRTDADARGPRLAHREAFVLPSRRPALDACRAALEAGPVLLTGDAGVGKTWLWRRLEAESAGAGRWLGVDLTPANDPADLYRLIGHGLGLGREGRDGPGPSRVDLADFLAERQADGDPRALVIEEAHNLSAAVWEEVRVLANRLGAADGFAALVLVGQTPLARRFSTRPFAAIEARLAARVHLGPVDADEARDLLCRHRPGRAWALDEVEAIHRDAGGNPARILRRLGPAEPTPRPAPTSRVEPAPPSSSASIHPVPLTGPDRPPLRVEDNLIEVGWSPEDAEEGEPSPRADLDPPAEGEEAVRDHYAALQAWREWAANQARLGVGAGVAVEPEGEPAEVDVEGESPDGSPLDGRPTLWADGEQRFAPFGQLFTRMARPREPE